MMIYFEKADVKLFLSSWRKLEFKQKAKSLPIRTLTHLNHGSTFLQPSEEVDLLRLTYIRWREILVSITSSYLHEMAVRYLSQLLWLTSIRCLESGFHALFYQFMTVMLSIYAIRCQV